MRSMSLKNLSLVLIAMATISFGTGCTDDGSLGDFGSGTTSPGSPFVTPGAIAQDLPTLATSPETVTVRDAGASTYLATVDPQIGTMEFLGNWQWRFNVNSSLVISRLGESITIFKDGAPWTVIPLNIIVNSTFEPIFPTTMVPCSNALVYFNFQNGVHSRPELNRAHTYTMILEKNLTEIYRDETINTSTYSAFIDPARYQFAFGLGQINDVKARFIVNGGPFQGQSFETPLGQGITILPSTGATCAPDTGDFTVNNPASVTEGQTAAITLLDSGTGQVATGSSSFEVRRNGQFVAGSSQSNPSIAHYSYAPSAADVGQTLTFVITKDTVEYFGAATAIASSGGGGGGGGGSGGGGATGDLTIEVQSLVPWESFREGHNFTIKALYQGQLVTEMTDFLITLVGPGTQAFSLLNCNRTGDAELQCNATAGFQLTVFQVEATDALQRTGATTFYYEAD